MSSERARAGEAAVRIEMLPAQYGDCLWIECYEDEAVTRIVIDGGTAATYPKLKERLLSLSREERIIDVLVVTHIDGDHIGGVLKLIADEALGVKIGDVWFNGLQHLPGRYRSVRQGETLSETLVGARGAQALPWNRAFDGGPVSTQGDYRHQLIPLERGPRLTLLAPSPRKLTGLAQIWERELERARAGEPARQTPQPPTRAAIVTADDVRALAEERSRPDNAAPNGSSIAFLLEHRGRTALLTGDSHIDALGAAIEGLAGDGNRLVVDLCKLAHHGSEGNIDRDLLDVVAARNYLISTNSERFNHPDPRAVARVIAYGSPERDGSRGGGHVLWFNYRTPRTTLWERPDLRESFGYDVRYPVEPARGVAITLPPRTS